MGDVQAFINIVKSDYNISDEEINIAEREKYKKLKKYYNYTE